MLDCLATLCLQKEAASWGQGTAVPQLVCRWWRTHARPHMAAHVTRKARNRTTSIGNQAACLAWPRGAMRAPPQAASPACVSNPLLASKGAISTLASCCTRRRHARACARLAMRAPAAGLRPVRGHAAARAHTHTCPHTDTRTHPPYATRPRAATSKPACSCTHTHTTTHMPTHAWPHTHAPTPPTPPAPGLRPVRGRAAARQGLYGAGARA